MRDLYAVVGYPVSHSKSPAIHRLFAAQTGEDLEYRAIAIEPGQFAGDVESFRVRGGKGLNITLPFKHEAFALADTRQQRAIQAGAANTLWFDDQGRILADNTDGIGLVRDLTNNLGVELAQAKLLLIGAGGAARGVVGPLLATGPECLWVANRTEQRAVDLVASYPDSPRLQAVSLAGLADKRFDVIINATAASLQGELPLVPVSALRQGGVCYDLMYASEPTAFVRWGRQARAGTSVDGFGMLVEQAAESFFIWRGVRPQTAPVIEQLQAKKDAVC